MTTIGIDPGQRTGVAIYRDGKLCELRTVSPADIEALIVEHAPALVVFEDSRMQSPVFSRGTNPRAMLKIARNVGEIDQLCRQIEDICKRLGIKCIGVSPHRKGRKLNAKRFAVATGWTALSNRHTRDAAMVAWLYRRAQPAQVGFAPHPTRRRRGQP